MVMGQKTIRSFRYEIRSQLGYSSEPLLSDVGTFRSIRAGKINRTIQLNSWCKGKFCDARFHNDLQRLLRRLD